MKMRSNPVLALLGLLISLYLVVNSNSQKLPGLRSEAGVPNLLPGLTAKEIEPTFANQESTKAAVGSPLELFISEYIEGSGNNKALEIYNGTGSTVDLNSAKYDIQMYFNGSQTAGLTIPLTGSVAIGDVYVLAHASATAAILTKADQTNTAGWYNGDDAVVLRKNGVIIDSIGQIGFNPNTEWGSGLTSTADNTLQRRAANCIGDSNGLDEFFPAQQWVGFGTDYVSGLGLHAASCTSVIGSCGGTAVRIHEVQGSGMNSPLDGTDVIVEGVVSGDFQGSPDGLGGFFLQEEPSQVDGDPSTSEGIFVYDEGFGVSVSTGQVVRVLGNIREYFGLTELSNISAIEVCQGTASLSLVQVTLPVSDVSDWERWEGMLINLPQKLYATENYNLGRYGEVELSVNGRLFTPTQIISPGSHAIDQQELNDRSRIQLDDGRIKQNPLPLPPYLGPDKTLRLGDTVAGVTGVLGFSFERYEIHPTSPVQFTRANPRMAFPIVASGSLKIVSTNLLNYFTTLDNGSEVCGPAQDLECRGADNVEEFTRQKSKIFKAFLSMEPDIAGLVEIENNATAAVQDLVDTLNAQFGVGTYAYINTGIIGTDAIKVAIVYKPSKVTPVGPFKILDSSVDPDFVDTKNRPSLAQTFDISTGSRFTVVVNHLKSKGSGCSDVQDPDAGDGQGNCNLTRTKAVHALIDWLATDPTGSGDPDFLIIGDLNAYAKEDPIVALKNAGYVNLLESFRGSTAYSYTFEGQSGTLDYAFASPGMASQVGDVYELHVNADEPSALDYNDYNQPLLFSADVYRYGDHDPLLVVIGPRKKVVYLPIISR